jgi:hypothetical protein
MIEERDPVIERIAATLRRDEPLAPQFDARVMAAVRLAPDSGSLARLWAALREPRPVMVSPIGALSLAAGLAVVVMGTALVARRAAELPEAPAATNSLVGGGAAGQPVQFLLVMPAAREVSLVGDFNDWDTADLPMERAAREGVWTVTVPLAPGRYRYTFVVDGTRWIPDPGAPRGVEDDFGRPSSVITVGEHGT